MRVVITGGRGRLGQRMATALAMAGHDVHAPARGDVNWGQPEEAFVAMRGADRVLALAAYTDVARAQVEVDRCVADTVGTALATVHGAQRMGVRMHYLSTDYVLPLLRGEEGGGVYAASKLVAERLVYMAGGYVGRAAFVTPEQARRWSWVDGVSVANRCWVEDLVPELVEWITADAPERMVNLGPADAATLRDLLAARQPAHPALKRVAETREQLAEVCNPGLRPADTTWG